jgi:hypothetical protein
MARRWTASSVAILTFCPRRSTDCPLLVRPEVLAQGPLEDVPEAAQGQLGVGELDPPDPDRGRPAREPTRSISVADSRVLSGTTIAPSQLHA